MFFISIKTLTFGKIKTFSESMKKEKNKITKSSFILLAFLMGMVVLLSPCSIQNSLQDVLGLEIKKTKTAFQQNRTCNASVNQVDFSKISKEKKQLNQSEVVFFNSVFSFPKTEQLSFTILLNQHSQKTAVPLYILFKRLKCFI
jgi:hypothetical protein